MDDSISRVLVKTMVRKAIKDIKETPARSTRNLVDLALNFSDGRFQKQFFQTAQRMLADENSAYYDLIRDVLSYADEEKLLTFGMNLGYNGCTAGAEKIRKIEAKEGFNIPWIISLKVASPAHTAREESCHRLIEQGEALGIHAWQLFTKGYASTCLDLANGHPDSAFVLFCSGEDMDDAIIERVRLCDNLAIAVLFDGAAPAVCRKLREAGLLFGLYYPYTAQDLERIESGNLLRAMERFHGIFSILIPESGCSAEVQGRVYDAVIRARMEQKYRTIVWEGYQDAMMVDRIISDDGCWLAFDEQGNQYAGYQNNGCDTPNLFRDDLKQILQAAFPKGRMES